MKIKSQANQHTHPIKKSLFILVAFIVSGSLKLRGSLDLRLGQCGKS